MNKIFKLLFLVTPCFSFFSLLHASKMENDLDNQNFQGANSVKSLNESIGSIKKERFINFSIDSDLEELERPRVIRSDPGCYISEIDSDSEESEIELLPKFDPGWYISEIDSEKWEIEKFKGKEIAGIKGYISKSEPLSLDWSKNKIHKKREKSSLFERKRSTSLPLHKRFERKISNTAKELSQKKGEIEKSDDNHLYKKTSSQEGGGKDTNIYDVEYLLDHFLSDEVIERSLKTFVEEGEFDQVKQTILSKKLENIHARYIWGLMHEKNIGDVQKGFLSPLSRLQESHNSYEIVYSRLMKIYLLEKGDRQKMQQVEKALLRAKKSIKEIEMAKEEKNLNTGGFFSYLWPGKITVVDDSIPRDFHSADYLLTHFLADEAVEQSLKMFVEEGKFDQVKQTILSKKLENIQARYIWGLMHEKNIGDVHKDFLSSSSALQEAFNSYMNIYSKIDEINISDREKIKQQVDEAIGRTVKAMRQASKDNM